jgi:hypothetical protein
MNCLARELHNMRHSFQQLRLFTTRVRVQKPKRALERERKSFNNDSKSIVDDERVEN